MFYDNTSPLVFPSPTLGCQLTLHSLFSSTVTLHQQYYILVCHIKSFSSPDGAPLPLTSDSTASASPPQPKASKSVQRRLPGKPQKRSAETCRSGNNYMREKFRPGPISMF